MKKLLLIWMLLWGLKASSQNIVRIEYFFDADPGFGNGISIPITPDSVLVNLNATIDLSGISSGIHILYVRSLDDQGHWSLTNRRLIAQAPHIVSIEYFFDVDPGFGNGIPIPVNTDTSITGLSVNIDLAGIGNGDHTLYIRSKDNYGKWSLTNRKVIVQIPRITAIEYFFDTDPGFGNGISIPVTPDTVITNLNANLSLNGLNPGTHTLYIRSRDGHGKWSLTNRQSITYCPFGTSYYYRDMDQDGYGTLTDSVLDCNTPLGYAANFTDCDDNNALIHEQFPFFVDSDSDGYGSGNLVLVCAENAFPPPAGYSTDNTDCDDNDFSTHHLFPFYADADGDFFAASLDTFYFCSNINTAINTPPPGYILTAQIMGQDCNDNDFNLRGLHPFYIDADQDGYGVGSPVPVCAANATTPPPGYSLNTGDCDDTNPVVYPTAPEICDGFDNNCDGIVDTIRINGVKMYLPLNGNTNDVTGNQHHAGNFNATLTSGHTATNNSAYSFNGSNSRMEIPSHPDLTTPNFTLSVWLYYNAIPSSLQNIISKPHNCSWSDAYGIWFMSGQFYFGWSGSPGSMEYYGITPPTAGSWHHLAMTFDDNANQTKVYIDNVLQATYATSVSIGHDNSPIIIGSEYENCNLGFYFDGKIDEVSFFNRALSATEIGNLYNSSPLIPLQYPFYADLDGDGYGTGNPVILCAPNATTPPSGYSINNTDCDDNNALLHIGFPFYIDADGDGFGVQPSIIACAPNAATPPPGYAINGDDCDDTKSYLYPGVIEKMEYFIDNDPGPGNGTAIALTPTPNADSIQQQLSINLPLSLSPGHHVFSARAAGCKVSWGVFEHRSFIVTPANFDAGPLVTGELFFDNDPGLGNGIAFAVPVLDTVNQTIPVNIPDTTTPGLHVFAIRIKDSLGQWSHFYHGNITILPPLLKYPPITSVEYFIDTDPGIGNAQPLSIPNTDTLSQTFAIPLSSNLAEGIHLLGIRVKDSLGKWGHFEHRLFYVDDSGPVYNPIVAAEYIVDADPGVGNGTTIPLTPADSTNQSVTLSIPPSLLTGNHRIAFRVRNLQGRWSFIEFPSTIINVKAYLQGYYAGQGMMHPVLQNEGQPNPANDVDTVFMDMHAATSPFNLLYTSTGVLQTNGQVIGNIPSGFQGNQYYLALRHRNTVQTWSSNPILINLVDNVYDFTTSANKAYGENMAEVEPGIWALYSGDINQDENVDLLDVALSETDINNFEFGYFATDINGDGNVDLLDSPVLEDNVNGFIFSNHP